MAMASRSGKKRTRSCVGADYEALQDPTYVTEIFRTLGKSKGVSAVALRQFLEKDAVPSCDAGISKEIDLLLQSLSIAGNFILDECQFSHAIDRFRSLKILQEAVQRNLTASEPLDTALLYFSLIRECQHERLLLETADLVNDVVEMCQRLEIKSLDIDGRGKVIHMYLRRRADEEWFLQCGLSKEAASIFLKLIDSKRFQWDGFEQLASETLGPGVSER